MKEHVIRIYVIFLIIACMIIAGYAIFDIGNEPASMFAEDTQVALSAKSITNEDDGFAIVTLDTSTIKEAGDCLSFNTIFTDVYVYADNDLIYKRTGSGSLFMKSNGNIWHFVKVSGDSQEIIVKLIHRYNKADLTIPSFFAGDYYNLKASLVRESSPALIISILDIVFGFGMVIYYFSTKHLSVSTTKMFNFGIASIMLGIWSSGETNAIVVLFENRALAGVLAFLILIFIPSPFIIYIHFTLWPEDKYLYRITPILCLVNFVLVIGLALAGIMDLKESVIITHCVWAIAIIYTAVAVVVALKRHFRKKYKVPMPDKSKTSELSKILFNDTVSTDADEERITIFVASSMLILIAISVVDIALYWSGTGTQNDLFGRFLLLSYIVIHAYINIRESLKAIENGKMAAYYKKLANTDSMTALYNRNAFNNDVAQLSINTEYSIISLDLNNLKSVNDNLGHQAGDRYIINAANIINDIFGHEGTCYRIGGDEFSVIIQKPDSGMVTEKLIKKLEKEIEIHNKNNPSEPVFIAYGYHSHTPDSAYDYNETLHIADEKMYENKRLQKSVQ